MMPAKPGQVHRVEQVCRQPKRYGDDRGGPRRCLELSHIHRRFLQMLTDEDIERCAKSMLAQYGATAAHRAQRRAEEAVLRGASMTASIWSDVAAKIEQLQAKAPAERETTY